MIVIVEEVNRKFVLVNSKLSDEAALAVAWELAQIGDPRFYSRPPEIVSRIAVSIDRRQSGE